MPEKENTVKLEDEEGDDCDDVDEDKVEVKDKPENVSDDNDKDEAEIITDFDEGEERACKPEKDGLEEDKVKLGIRMKLRNRRTMK